MPRFYRYLVLLSLILLAGCGGMAEAPGQSDKPQPGLEPCRLNAPGLADYLPAKCTTLTVFEDRAAQRGRTIDLHIAVVPAISRHPRAPDFAPRPNALNRADVTRAILGKFTIVNETAFQRHGTRFRYGLR